MARFYFKLNLVRLSKIIFLIATCVPYFLSIVSSRVRDYIVIKAIFLIALCLINISNIKSKVSKIDYYFILLTILVNTSILWGDFFTETLLVSTAYFNLLVITYFSLRFSKIIEFNSNYFLLFIIIEILTHLILFGPNRGSINGAYYIGSISSFMLLFYLEKNNQSIKHLLIVPIIGLLSGRRFALAYLISTPFKFRSFLIRIIAFSYTIYILLMINGLFPELYFILGYRYQEYEQVIMSIKNPFNLFFGQGIGSELFLFNSPTKGKIMHGGIFHNFYLSVLYHFGISGLFLLFLIIRIILKQSQGILKGFIIGWLLIALIDSPRDGHWILISLIALNENRKQISRNYNKSVVSVRI